MALWCFSTSVCRFTLLYTFFKHIKSLPDLRAHGSFVWKSVCIIIIKNSYLFWKNEWNFYIRNPTFVLLIVYTSLVFMGIFSCLIRRPVCSPQSLTRNTAIEVASTVKALHNETESLLVGRVPLVSSRWTWSGLNVCSVCKAHSHSPFPRHTCFWCCKAGPHRKE